MGCTLKPLDKRSDEWKHIAEYLKNTCTHEERLTFLYGYGPGTSPPELLDVFEIDRKGEAQRFAKHDKISNRKLLWHGTNIGVVVAICASGLRIMPHSGGRVGSGIYLASENGKSACYVQPAADGTGECHFGR